MAQGQTNLGALTFSEQSRLTRAILWRIGLLMIAVYGPGLWTVDRLWRRTAP